MSKDKLLWIGVGIVIGYYVVPKIKGRILTRQMAG